MNSRELAKLLGVSQATVSRALNGSALVTDETKERVLRKAAEFGFELNSHARSLKTNKTGTIGVLFSKYFQGMTGTPMLAHLYDSLQRELIKYDYDVMIVYDYDTDGGSVFERVIRKRKVDGLITVRAVLSEHETNLIKNLNFPCVPMLMARQKNEAPYSSYSDIEYGGRLVGRFYGTFSEYDVVYVGFEGEEMENSRRIRGLRKGLHEHGRVLSEKNVHSCLMTFDSGYETALKLLSTMKKRKLAIFAYNDIIALGMLNAFREADIDVPEQVQLIGLDDIPLSTWIRPHLSTLHVAIEEMVPNGCKLLRDMIEGRDITGYKTSYKPRLVHRDTTMPVKG